MKIRLIPSLLFSLRYNAKNRARNPKNDNDDFRNLVSEQRSELMAAETFESDLDLAFRLQLQEALAASLALEPSSSPSPSAAAAPVPHPPRNDDAPRFAAAQSEELSRLEQELKDREQSAIAMRREREDLARRIHDQRVAREILRIHDDDWSDWGENFAKPFGEGSSKSAIWKDDYSEESESEEDDSVFGIYFKGLVSEERIEGSDKTVLAGIGVAICDSRDNLIFEVRKPLLGNGLNKAAADAKALIEGLNAALALDLKRIILYCDYYASYQFISGRWQSRQNKIAALVDQVKSLQRKFERCETRLVARNEIKFAFKLARDAIQSQVNRTVESNQRKNLDETCVICLEDTDISQIFSVNGCKHRYCFSCMKQHVETKLREALVPKCPHHGCKSELDVDSCEKFLTPKFMEIMRQRKKEAIIPVTERVYCPDPRCSVLMSKTEVLEHSRKEGLNVDVSGARRCVKCNGVFCINCKVPWHRDMACDRYKLLNPNPPAEDAKLKLLALRNLWRQCIKCNLMIELAEGCFHMTCRCGYEFCYNCGAEWKDKKATCSCPLWDEDRIWHDRNRDFDEEEGEEEEEDDDFYDSDEESLF
ncbi:putative E3 ubiquitin-protein ligase rbrA [Morus notabilis]|uniref:RBR-type E3 ubiquitin transferase n=1 Tax=Morus notabilis TaxID=981085 RepID=W9RN55_9ROSA|nr:uncharacterized protein LOC21397561 [Morus notabilis]EXB98576.1 putative E3 ubiquitin-protein ligase rbrA [Morus notabilis]